MISQVTDSVIEEVTAWQNRPLDPILSYRLLGRAVRQNAPRRTSRESGGVRGDRSQQDGSKEVLGLWTSANEGAKFWLQILTEIRQRGVKDIVIACVDGLKGFPEAIETVFPKTTVPQPM